MTESKVTVEQLAKAALDLDALRLRAVTQEFLRQNPRLSEINRPNTNDSIALAAAASLIELFALRSCPCGNGAEHLVSSYLYCVAARTRCTLADD